MRTVRAPAAENQRPDATSPVLNGAAEPRPRAEAPLVVVVVLNWCGEEVTAACLRSVQQSDYAPLRVLLVDNGSPDGSGERLHQAFPEVPYLQTNRNLGYTGGNNRGVEWALAAGADFVLILNNDAVLEPGAIGKLVDAARAEPRVGAVAPKILYHDHPDRIWFGGGDLSRMRAVGRHRREGQLDVRSDLEAVQPMSFLSGCCLLLPADVLREQGGFAEDFFAYVEDVELSLRLSAAGYRLLYQPAARILHHSPLSDAAPSPFQILHRDRNRRRLARRRYGVLHRLAFAAFFYPSRAVLLARYLAGRDWERARAIWRGMLEP